VHGPFEIRDLGFDLALELLATRAAVYALFMQKSGGFARTAHPISAAVSKPKVWTKLADRALGGAVAAVGVVFLFSSVALVYLPDRHYGRRISFVDCCAICWTA